MTRFIGKSGADRIFQYHKLVCKVLGRYHDKFLTAVELTRAAGLITDAEAAQVILLVTAADTYCAILAKVAANSGFTTG